MATVSERARELADELEGEWRTHDNDYIAAIEQALLAERRLAMEAGLIYDKYNTPAMKALHDLTPGGSEFAGDPKYCADYIRKREHSQHEMIVRLTLRVRELEKQVSELDGKALRAAAEKEVGK